MARREHPRYENTEWDDYEFREYPMMIYPGSKDGGKTPDRDPTRPGRFLQEAVTVNSEAERLAALGLDEAEAEEAAPAPVPTKAKLIPTGKGTSRLQTPDDERAELLEQCETKGIQVDKTWSIARLQDALDTFNADVG